MDALKKHVEETERQRRKQIAMEVAPNATDAELDAIMAEYDRINKVHVIYPKNRFGTAHRVEVQYV